VTEVVRSSAPRDYRPDLPDIEREALYDLEQIKKGVSSARFVAARTRFELRREAIEEQISTAQLDDAGRTNASRHVTAFFNALEALR
jgi:hypothetical protein